jgi:hypothetical protein
MPNDGWGWFDPNTTITPDNGPNMPSPDPAGVARFNNYGAVLNSLAGLLGPQVAGQGNALPWLGGNLPLGAPTSQTQNPLANMFQTLFGGGLRRRGGRGGRGGMPSGQQWLQPGGGVRPPYVPQYSAGPDGINGYDYGGQAPQYAGQYGYIWRGDQPIAYDPNLGVPAGYSVFHRGQDALQGLPGITGGGGTGAGVSGYGGRESAQRGGRPPITGATHYRGGPAGAPWFANADGTVFANGMNAPDIGGQGGVDPNSPYYIAPGLPGGAATIPWQGSWADPSSPNFYLRQFGLQTPSDYFNPGGGGRGGGGWGGGMTAAPQGPGPQGPPPGPSGPPPGSNGPTGPAAPAGNFNMYANMPYAGGMGPYSGWLPPAAGTQTDWGGPGQYASPMAQAAAQYGTTNLGMPAVSPFGPNDQSGWLPPVPGTQTDWGGPGQYASPMEQAAAYGAISPWS